MKPTQIIGVDMGGTKIHCGKISGAKLAKESKIATPAKEDEKVVLNALVRAIEEVIDNSCEGIGIGVPSVVDTEKGIVYDVMAIPSWKEVHLKRELESHFGVPVRVNNDANCFALGEKYFGKGKDFQHIVGVTLGTGLGTGIVLNNKLYTGANCGAGEIGCFPYKDSILEDYCAKHFFINQHNTTGIEVFQQALAGNPKALAIFNELGGHLGYMVQLIMLAYDPEAIIFGGSVSGSFPYFIDTIKGSLASFPYPNSASRIVIEKSELENVALFGAAALMLEN
jgi:glucokinase